MAVYFSNMLPGWHFLPCQRYPLCARRFKNDRVWKPGKLSTREANTVDDNRLSDVTARTPSARSVYDDILIFHASVSGRVFTDFTDAGEARIRDELGIAGVAVYLLDANGSVIAATVTARDGGYRFDHLDLGQYQVRVALPPGAKTTTPATQEVHITRGGVPRSSSARNTLFTKRGT